MMTMTMIMIMIVIKTIFKQWVSMEPCIKLQWMNGKTSHMSRGGERGDWVSLNRKCCLLGVMIFHKNTHSTFYLKIWRFDSEVTEKFYWNEIFFLIFQSSHIVFWVFKGHFYSKIKGTRSQEVLNIYLLTSFQLGWIVNWQTISAWEEADACVILHECKKGEKGKIYPPWPSLCKKFYLLINLL